MRKIHVCVVLTSIALCTSQVFAHYLWVTIDQKTGEHGTANIYFEGGPSAGDGRYLDPFVERGTTWIRTLAKDGVAKLSVNDTKQDKKRWLQATLSAAGPRSIESYGKWGVYTYGKTEVLLHYYAKNIDATKKSDRVALGRAKQQALDIVPIDSDQGEAFQVLWQGKPAAKRAIRIRGGGLKTATTDNEGRFFVEPKSSGRITFHVSVDEKVSGKEGDRDYDIKRHHATLILNLAVKKSTDAK